MLELMDEAKKVWVRDADRMACVVCHKRFNLLKRKHHCRACGEVICSSCSLYQNTKGFSVRLCVTCAGCSAVFPSDGSQSRSRAESSVSNESSNETPSPTMGTRQRSLSTLSWLQNAVNSSKSNQMPDAPCPSNEEQRLNAVRQLHLDGIFPLSDMYCDVAAKITRARIAVVSLMEENEQFLLSRIGIGRDRIPRKLAPCAHTICQPNGFMVVLDMKKDERFANSPLVKGSKSGFRIRYYAGATIFDKNTGEPVGTVAVMDTKPRRRFHQDHLQILRHLSILVSVKLAELEADSDSETL
ncbi:TPA: hypothetical protein N0F65_011728 [Lagenidium giganteum]|uniref:FYVE-type domain-containing protein n=1 Tax=Lagenidium giganteum TaxID=4803 RepID=A0AAV2YHQ8_9STRA|nr:TPA: hypothetical protein N0F65_011728 [Lagenidium giganteum]